MVYHIFVLQADSCADDVLVAVQVAFLITIGLSVWVIRTREYEAISTFNLIEKLLDETKEK